MKRTTREKIMESPPALINTTLDITRPFRKSYTTDLPQHFTGTTRFSSFIIHTQTFEVRLTDSLVILSLNSRRTATHRRSGHTELSTPGFLPDCFPLFLSQAIFRLYYLGVSVARAERERREYS